MIFRATKAGARIISTGRATGERRGRDDDSHRRIETDFTGASGGGGEHEFHYFTAGWQLIETRREDPASADNPDDVPYLQYVWSPRYVDAPVLRDRDADGSADGTLEERLYYTTDGIPNITALVEPGGDVVERYTYDAYGRREVRHPTTWALLDGSNPTVSAYGNRLGFAGYQYDEATGLYDVRNRPYDPWLGRWLVRDYEGYIEGPGLYEYARSNSIGRIDPLGLQSRTSMLRDELARAGDIEGARQIRRAQTSVDRIAGATQAFDAGFQVAHDRTLATADEVVSRASFGAVDNVGLAAFCPEDRARGRETAGTILDVVELLHLPGAVRMAGRRALREGGERLTRSVDDNIARNAPRRRGWQPGDDVHGPTRVSDTPSDRTVRRREWMNEAQNPTRPDYTPEDMARMRQGKPPRRYNSDKGGMESMERAHEPIPKRDGGTEIVPQWPQEHAARDPHRNINY